MYQVILYHNGTSVSYKLNNLAEIADCLSGYDNFLNDLSLEPDKYFNKIEIDLI
jgi:hypothetical protein